ncbi:hypothetical protein BDFB_003050, partial [Asbolus verrucosus]
RAFSADSTPVYYSIIRKIPTGAASSLAPFSNDQRFHEGDAFRPRRRNRRLDRPRKAIPLSIDSTR